MAESGDLQSMLAEAKEEDLDTRYIQMYNVIHVLHLPRENTTRESRAIVTRPA